MTHHELTLATPLGPVRLAARGDGLVGIWFCGQKYEGPRPQGTGKPPATETAAVLEQGTHWLEAYFAGKFDAPVPKLAPEGTVFQQGVWAGLSRIVPGTRSSYGALAAAIGKPAAVRAVAAAVGRNPLSVLVPCHRVLGSSGQLTGFAGGLGRKRALLDREAGRAWPWLLAVKAHQAQYADPIEVQVGDSVRFVDRADDGEYAGWKWAVAADGRQGWVPRIYFSAVDGVALRGYSARELNVAAGDPILELDEFSGWIWGIDRKQQCGWVPATALSPDMP